MLQRGAGKSHPCRGKNSRHRTRIRLLRGTRQLPFNYSSTAMTTRSTARATGVAFGGRNSRTRAMRAFISMSVKPSRYTRFSLCIGYYGARSTELLVSLSSQPFNWPDGPGTIMATGESPRGCSTRPPKFRMVGLQEQRTDAIRDDTGTDCGTRDRNE